MAKLSKTADLLKLLGKPPSIEPPAHKTDTPSAAASMGGRSQPRETAVSSVRSRPTKSSRAPASNPPKALRGKAIQFYFHEADEKLIREFAVWLAAHRKRINDSLVVKAVLRAAKTGPALLAAYDEAVSIDGRLKTHKKSKQHP